MGLPKILQHIVNTVVHITSAERTAWNAKARTASPTFTGTPKAPTAADGTNNTQIATTAFVQAALNSAKAVTEQSKGANASYFKIGDFYIQFGITTTPTATSFTITFPKAFPNACLFASGDLVSADGITYQRVVNSVSKTGMTVYCSGKFPWSWIAIGY